MFGDVSNVGVWDRVDWEWKGVFKTWEECNDEFCNGCEFVWDVFGEWVWMNEWLFVLGVRSSNIHCVKDDYTSFGVIIDDIFDWYGKICSKNITSIDIKISFVSKS